MFFSWITLLISIPILWLLQNIIHELSHGLTVKLGWNWDFSIWPFPSRRTGRFTFAHVKYFMNKSSQPIPDKGYALISIMPKISNLFFIIISACLLFLQLGHPIFLSVIAVFMICNYIDSFVGLKTAYQNKEKKINSDIWKFQTNSGLTVNEVRIFSGLMILTTTIFIALGIVPCFLGG